jgi:hypothetical protein
MMLRTIERSRFWQFGGVSFILGVGVGVAAGRSLFALVLLLTVIVLTGVVLVLVAAIRFANFAGEEAERTLFANLYRFSFVASAAIATFAGYCLGVLLSE